MKNLSLSVSASLGDFSNISYDQLHEQNNKDIKASSGYINLVNLEDKDFLRKLEICFPEIRFYLNEMKNKVSPKHTEQYTSFIQRYLKDGKRMLSKFTINPFSTTSFKN